MRDIKSLLLVLLSAGLILTWVYHLYDKTMYSQRRTEVYIKDSIAVAEGIQDSLYKLYNSTITEDDIEQFIGVSKDFNVFELQGALAKKDLAKAMRIVQYFEANPKAAPIQLILPSLYGFFSKVFMVFGAGSQDEKSVANAIGVKPFFIRDYMQAASIYQYAGVEKTLLLLHRYNLRSIGVHDAGNSDASLMKEMIVKIVTD